MTAPTPYRLQQILEYEPMIRRLARQLIRDENRIDDVVQQTWLTVIESPPDAGPGLSRWLSKVVRNIIRRGHRDEERRQRRERVVHETQGRNLVAPSAARVAEDLEAYQLILTSIRALPEPYRSTLWCRFLREQSPKAIAEENQCSEATVRTQIFRALGLLRAELRCRNREWTLVLAPLSGFPKSTAILGGKMTAAAVATLVIGGAVLGLWMTNGDSSPNPADSSSMTSHQVLPGSDSENAGKTEGRESLPERYSSHVRVPLNDKSQGRESSPSMRASQARESIAGEEHPKQDFLEPKSNPTSIRIRNEIGLLVTNVPLKNPRLVAGAYRVSIESVHPGLNFYHGQQSRKDEIPEDAVKILRWADGEHRVAPVPPEMVRVGKGIANLGLDQEAALKWMKEHLTERDIGNIISGLTPKWSVFVDEFLIDRTEVTQGQFQELLKNQAKKEALSHKRQEFRRESAPEIPFGNIPMTAVTHEEATQCAVAMGKTLPSEVQWTRAASGNTLQRFVWGDQWNDQHCASQGSQNGLLAPVMSYEADRSWCGAFDMMGNAMEWTSSSYIPYPGFEPLPASQSRDRYLAHFHPSQSVVRGGSSRGYELSNNRLMRQGFSPGDFFSLIGFRCTKRLIPGQDLVYHSMHRLGLAPENYDEGGIISQEVLIYSPESIRAHEESKRLKDTGNARIPSTPILIANKTIAFLPVKAPKVQLDATPPWIVLYNQAGYQVAAIEAQHNNLKSERSLRFASIPHEDVGILTLSVSTMSASTTSASIGPNESRSRVQFNLHVGADDFVSTD